MFWTLERVNWREEATGVGARKRSTAAIHAGEGGTGTRAVTGAVNGAAETFVCMGTSTGTHVSARAGACAGRCTGTGTGVRVSACADACTGQVHGRVKVSGDLMEPCGIKLGDNVRLPAHQCHGDGCWRSRGDGSRNGSRDRRDIFPQG